MKKFFPLPCLIDLIGFAGLLFMGRQCRSLIEQHRHSAALLLLYVLVLWAVLFIFFLRNLKRA